MKFELNGKGLWTLVTDGKQFAENPAPLEDGVVVTVATKTVAVYALK